MLDSSLPILIGRFSCQLSPLGVSIYVNDPDAGDPVRIIDTRRICSAGAHTERVIGPFPETAAGDVVAQLVCRSTIRRTVAEENRPMVIFPQSKMVIGLTPVRGKRVDYTGGGLRSTKPAWCQYGYAFVVSLAASSVAICSRVSDHPTASRF